MDPESPIPGLGEQHNIAPICKLDARLDRFEPGHDDADRMRGYTDLPERTPGLSADRWLERLGERAKTIGQLGILRIIDRTGNHGYAVMVERLL